MISTETIRDDLLKEIFMIMLRIERIGINEQFCWVPAQIGVEGNEIADLPAKNALEIRNEIRKILNVPF